MPVTYPGNNWMVAAQFSTFDCVKHEYNTQRIFENQIGKCISTPLLYYVLLCISYNILIR